jgi:hypothetical protein
MERALKWALPALIIANIALVWSGVLEAGAALIVAIALELSVFLVASRQVLAAIRNYRRDRAAGLEIERALEDGLTVIFPRRVARLVALEPRVWYYLARWLFRRRPLQPNEFSYNRRSPLGTLLVVLFISAPVEIFIVELLVPWTIVRWALAILAIYSLLWVAAFAVAMRVLPHRLEADGLRLRYGFMAEGFVPYSSIESVEHRRTKLPEKAGEGLYVPKTGAVGYLPIGGRADVTIRLNDPVSLQGLLTVAPPVLVIHFGTDAPDRLAAALRERLVSKEEVAATDQHTFDFANVSR